MAEGQQERLAVTGVAQPLLPDGKGAELANSDRMASYGSQLSETGYAVIPALIGVAE